MSIYEKANSGSDTTSAGWSQLLAPLLETTHSWEFKVVVSRMGGYDAAQTGDIVLVK